MGEGSLEVRIAADIEGFEELHDQIDRVKEASRKLEDEMEKLAGMAITVRVRPERH